MAVCFLPVAELFFTAPAVDFFSPVAVFFAPVVDFFSPVAVFFAPAVDFFFGVAVVSSVAATVEASSIAPSFTAVDISLFSSIVKTAFLLINNIFYHKKKKKTIYFQYFLKKRALHKKALYNTTKLWYNE